MILLVSMNDKSQQKNIDSSTGDWHRLPVPLYHTERNNFTLQLDKTLYAYTFSILFISEALVECILTRYLIYICI